MTAALRLVTSTTSPFESSSLRRLQVVICLAIAPGCSCGRAVGRRRVPGRQRRDSASLCAEDFEHGTSEAVIGRLEHASNTEGLELFQETPIGRGRAISMVAGRDPDAVALYKRHAGADARRARWDARHEPGGASHHSGLWVGCYDLRRDTLAPCAGERPKVYQHLSIAVERPKGKRVDAYNDWMRMRTWEAVAWAEGGESFFGNSTVDRNNFAIEPSRRVCLKVDVRRNPDPARRDKALLAAWKSHRHGEIAAGHPLEEFPNPAAVGSGWADYPQPATAILNVRFSDDRGMGSCACDTGRDGTCACNSAAY